MRHRRDHSGHGVHAGVYDPGPAAVVNMSRAFGSDETPRGSVDKSGLDGGSCSWRYSPADVDESERTEQCTEVDEQQILEIENSNRKA